MRSTANESPFFPDFLLVNVSFFLFGNAWWSYLLLFSVTKINSIPRLIDEYEIWCSFSVKWYHTLFSGSLCNYTLIAALIFRKGRLYALIASKILNKGRSTWVCLFRNCYIINQINYIFFIILNKWFTWDPNCLYLCIQAQFHLNKWSASMATNCHLPCYTIYKCL